MLFYTAWAIEAVSVCEIRKPPFPSVFAGLWGQERILKKRKRSLTFKRQKRAKINCARPNLWFKKIGNFASPESAGRAVRTSENSCCVTFYFSLFQHRFYFGCERMLSYSQQLFFTVILCMFSRLFDRVIINQLRNQKHCCCLLAHFTAFFPLPLFSRTAVRSSHHIASSFFIISSMCLH